ncbi:MAG: hypothetical protein CL624_11655 [Arcobacter sp.]|nr:hypothetical protein [Arcobacter sp.]|tara:strand:+ start:8525 stop:10738 length:2214 start_codon:yes stop_codon:yes gene_type:complete
MKIIKLFNKKSSNQSLNTFLNKMKSSTFDDDLLNDFNNKLDTFLSRYNITEYDDFIKYNYLHFLFLFQYQKDSPEGRSQKTLNEFLNVCLRILELYIFIVNKRLIPLKTIFFTINKYDDCIYSHFKNISADISNEDICVQYLKNNKNPQIFLDDDYYKSTSMPVIYEKGFNNNTHFNQIFKLENSQVQAIFMGNLSINNEKKNSRGKGNLAKRKDIEEHIFSHEDIYSNKSIEKNSSKERKIDFHNTNKQRISAVFKNFNLTSKPIHAYEIDSSYKKHLVNKAISTQLTKNSMNLASTYTFPHISQLKLLVEILQNNEDIIKCLILCSIFTALSIKNLIYSFLNIHNKLEYQSRRKIFQAKIPKDIYSSKATETVHIKLNDELEKITSVLYEHYKNEKINLEDSTVDSFIDQELKKVKQTLTQSLRKLDKTIKLTFNNLNNCLRFYFNQFHKNSDISILFHINNQSDKAKACYIQQPARLTNLENWINEFYLILTNTNTTLKVIEKEKQVGSSFFINSKDFKNFIDDLDNLYLKNNDPIVIFNLQMIFIRYSLALLLATRDYKNSCDLYNFSKRLKILTIHEKAKNVKTAKRIIPLSDLSIRIINLFYSLKRSSTDFKNYSPMLLINGKTEYIKTENVKAYLSTICTNIEQDRITNFLDKCKLNFGRHVFSTLARKENIKKDYENAFLGHFFLGNTDQGIYSNFNNLNYHKEIVDFIDNQITTEYLPSKIFMLEGKK